MEKAITVEFFGIERLKRLLKSCIGITGSLEEKEDYLKDLKYLDTIKDGVEINTFHEYVELLKKVSKISDGDYTISNYGTIISFYD